MNKLKERFPLLKICKKDGKQTYFYGQEQANSQWSGLVESFFTQAVPWGTKCGDITQQTTLFIKGKIKKLINMFTKNFILEKDHKQMSYLHSIVCPNCFLKMIFDIGLDCPRERLTLPVFLAENTGNSDESNLDPSSNLDPNNNKSKPNMKRELELTESELEGFVESSSNYLSKELERRRNSSIKKISILLDGQPQAIFIDEEEKTVWDLTQNKVVWFTLKESSSIAKIVSSDQEGLLIIGLLELNSKAIKDSWQHKILGWKKKEVILPNNNIINLAIKLIEKENEEEFFIAATYQDLTKEWSFENTSLLNWWHTSSKVQVAIACLMVMVLFASFLILMKNVFVAPVEITNNIKPLLQPSTKPNSRGKAIRTLLPTETSFEAVSEGNNNKIAFNLSSKSNLKEIDELLKLDIPKSVTSVEFLASSDNVFNSQKYIAIIETSSPTPNSVLRQSVTKQKGEFPFSISISSDLLTDQEYYLIVKSIDKNGVEKELERYNFIVVRSN